MDDLIAALQIFRKYTQTNYPTHCEHDVLMISGVEQDEPTEEERAELERLGFFWNDEYDCWASSRFGSA